MLYTFIYNIAMDSVLKGVLEEELERNLQKQKVFSNELAKYTKGSLVVVKVHGDRYLYRKYRDGEKIILFMLLLLVAMKQRKRTVIGISTSN